MSNWTGAWDFSRPGTLVFEVELYWAPEVTEDGNLRLDVTCQGDARSFILDGDTLQPMQEIASPPTVPASISKVRSDYVHQPAGDERGTAMRVNLNDDSGAAGSFHARDLLPDSGETRATCSGGRASARTRTGRSSPGPPRSRLRSSSSAPRTPV